MRTVRPSSADRIIRCPGSLQASENAPAWADEYDDTTTRDEGTACHWLAHQLGTGNKVEEGVKAPNNIAVDRPMFDAAHLYLQTLQAWGVPVTLEQSLAIPQLPFAHGTPDAFAFNPSSNTVYLADLKYGFRTVDVWPNWQLLCYCLGVAALLYRDYRELTFDLTIVQPRRWHVAGPVRRAIVKGTDMVVYVEALRMAVLEALSDKPPLRVGDQCKHCPGRARCGALRDTVADGLYIDTHDLPFAQAEEELRYLQRFQRLLAGYVSGLESQIEHGLRNGAHSTLYELRRQTGRVEWDADADTKVRALAKLMGVNVDKKPELITPTQARELMGDAVNIFARRRSGSFKLVPTDVEALKRIFGK